MKPIINIVLIVFSLGVAYYGVNKFSGYRALVEKTQELNSRITELSEKEDRLSKFKAHHPGILSEGYYRFISDMYNLARAHSLGISVDVQKPLVSPSTYEGVDQSKLKIVFTHISSRGGLASLLGALDACFENTAFLVEKMTQENDSLVIEAVLFGV